MTHLAVLAWGRDPKVRTEGELRRIFLKARARLDCTRTIYVCRLMESSRPLPESGGLIPGRSEVRERGGKIVFSVSKGESV